MRLFRVRIGYTLSVNAERRRDSTRRHVQRRLARRLRGCLFERLHFRVSIRLFGVARLRLCVVSPSLRVITLSLRFIGLGLCSVELGLRSVELSRRGIELSLCAVRLLRLFGVRLFPVVRR